MSLAAVDLTRLDLGGVAFDGSDLTDARFDHTHLRAASFRGAILRGTSFNSSDLTGADFSVAPATNRQPSAGEVASTMTGLVESPFVSYPSFRCAILRGAKFDNYPLFMVWPDHLRSELTILGADFSRTDLLEADLRRAGIVAIDGADARSGPEFPVSVDGLPARTEFSPPTSRSRAPADDTRGLSTIYLASLFAGSNWKDAQLSGDLAAILRRATPPTRDIACDGDRPDVSLTGFSRASW